MVMKKILIGVMMFLGMMINANAGLLGEVVDDTATVIDDSVNEVEDVTGKTLKTTDNDVEEVL